MALRTIVSVNNLSFSYGNGRLALDKISFTLEENEILGILGPNGAGKTTLLKILLGMLKGEGCVTMLGQDIRDLSPRMIARIVGYVPQDHHSVFAYRVIDYVLMGRAPHCGIFSIPSRKDYDKAYDVLRSLGLQDLADKPITEISGGQFQLVLIARALVQDAKILLMDEPISHLDVANAIKVLGIIRRLVRDKRVLGAIISLHDPLMAALYCDKILLLNKGRIAAYGSTENVLTPDNLHSVYGICFDIIRHNDRYLIIPVIQG